MNELRQKAEKALHDARAIMAAADKDSRGLTAEELATYDAHMAEFDAAQQTIRRAVALTAAEKAVEGPGPVAGRAAEHAGQPQTSPSEYRKAFEHYMRTGEIERRIMAFGTDTAGGIFVADEFRAQIVAYKLQANVMRRLASIFTTKSGAMTIPAVTAYGTATWTNEAGAFNSTDDTTATVTLNAYKLTRITPLTDELVNDAMFNVEEYLARSYGFAFGAAEETAFFVGTGTGQPTGIVGSSTLGKTASATNAITADELMDTFYACPRQYRDSPKSAWAMNDSTIKYIRKLVTGVSGDKTYIWAPGLRDGEPDVLLGKPVFAQKDMAAIGTGNKVAIFGDFSYYLIGDRAGVTLLRDPYSLAASGQIKFVASQRVDGILSLATAVYHLKLA
jgi:HK97 family phage major capsid protein